MGFLVIGYTHEDIDGNFGYLLKKLKEQNNYVLTDLTKLFMVLQKRPFIPQLNQKIPNFKSWVQGHLKDELEGLVGHTIFYGFFWVPSDVVQGVSNIFNMEPQKDGLTIRLWKFDDQGCPKLLSGIPKLVPFYLIWRNDASKLVEKEKFINSGILKYLEFCKFNILRDEMYPKS